MLFDIWFRLGQGESHRLCKSKTQTLHYPHTRARTHTHTHTHSRTTKSLKWLFVKERKKRKKKRVVGGGEQVSKQASKRERYNIWKQKLNITESVNVSKEMLTESVIYWSAKIMYYTFFFKFFKVFEEISTTQVTANWPLVLFINA